MAVQFGDFLDAIADTETFEVILPEADGLGSRLDNNSFKMLTLPEYL